jgi:hypothetical protein
MNGLKDMKKQERYADILEISQLLANELYYEKNKEDEADRYDKDEGPEMVQLEFDFEEKKKENEIKVKPSRQPVSIPDPIIDRDLMDSAFEVIDELKLDDKKKDISEDRTPVPLEEKITDDSAKPGKEDVAKPGKPELRISRPYSDSDRYKSPYDDGIV